MIRPNIRFLSPYSTARDDCQAATPINVYLDANESPYDNGVNRYPDPHQHALKAAVSRLKGIPEECIFAGNGSDEAIDLLFRIYCRPGSDNVVSIAPSYGMYAVSAAINDVELREVCLDPDTFALPTERLMEATDERTKLLFVCSPNNPTGNAFATEQLEQLANRFAGILVVDEAYVDFSPHGSLLPVLHRHPNLVVLQTLSKAWGMAGLRLGLAFAHPEVSAYMARVKYPYNINGPTQQEVIRRLASEPHATHVAEVLAERSRLTRALAASPLVVKVYPSDANFLLVKFRPAEATPAYDRLIAAGIIVRNRSRLPLCADCLRITVGTPRENDKLLAALDAPAS